MPLGNHQNDKSLALTSDELTANYAIGILPHAASDVHLITLVHEKAVLTCSEKLAHFHHFQVLGIQTSLLQRVISPPSHLIPVDLLA